MKPLSDLEKWKFLAAFDINQAASDFCGYSAEASAKIAGELGVLYLTDFVSRLATDAAADVLRSIPEPMREEIVRGLTAERSAMIREVLHFRPGTAGSLMAKEYLAVPLDYTVGQATEYLRSLRPDNKGKVSYIYVVDQDHRLEGVIQIRDLVFHLPAQPVKNILRSPVVQVETGMRQQDVARLLQRHRYLGLPVVDESQRLVGVISADSAMQAAEEEASDDIAKIVGTSPEEIRTQSVRRVVGFRLPWLFVNIVSGLICAVIFGAFQNDAATIVMLFVFVPLVLGLCESTGVQGATIVVRNITLGNIASNQLKKLFVRETLAGIIIGAVCGTAVGLAAFFWKANSRVGLALVASLTLAIIFSAIIGLSLPLIFKKFKIDPAIASGPLVLALCDIQALLVYFNLSNFILKMS